MLLSSPLEILDSTIFILSDVDVLVIMVTNEAQAESVLYGESGAVSGYISFLFYME